MKSQTRFLGIFLLIGALSFCPVLFSGQEAEGKKPLTQDVFDSWLSIMRPNISPDGKWVSYLETPQDGEVELVVINIKTKKEFRHPVGYSGEGTDAERKASPAFSYDGNYAVFLISPTQEEVKEAKKAKGKDKKKPVMDLGIMSLEDGVVKTVERVKSFTLPEKSGGWLAYIVEKPEEKKEKEADKEEAKEAKKEEKPAVKPEEKKGEEKKEKEKEKKRTYGTPMVLLSLKDGTETRFEDIMSCRFTEDGNHFFYIVSSKEKPETDGIYSLKPGETEGKALLAGKGVYKKLTLNKEETKAAFLTDRDDQESETSTFNLYGMNLGDGNASLWVSHTSTPGFPEGMAVSDKSDPVFSDDGHVILFGIKEIPEKLEKENEEGEEEKEGEDEEEEPKPKFDLWHWNDPYPQPQQKKMAERIRNNTWESVYYPETKKFVKLADKNLLDVSLSQNGRIAWADDIWPYSKMVAYDGWYYDIYVIDPQTGQRTLVKQMLYDGARLSPEGKYLYWFESGNWYVYDIAAKKTANVTETLDISFEQHDWDEPCPPRSYGVAGWTEGDASLLIYDRYDIWEILPDGSRTRMVTEGEGRKNHLTFRYVRLDREERFISPDKKILLRAVNEDTMAQGIFRDQVKGSTPPEKLIMEDKAFRDYGKAEEADVLLYCRMSFDEYPDLWLTDFSFKNPVRLTDLRRQMEPYIWGKAELRDFESSDGKPLKGILIKPDNFDPAKKYPLLVYIYETLHSMIHHYRNPSPGTSINMPYYVSNGYVIWMPDIEYDTGYPGRDALKCVLPGIQMLIREGYIDPKAIGIQGHSWGGYQIAYMVTQTNIFAAAEAGAPVSNMTSAYDGIRWGSGMVRQFQYERTQSRQGASLWEAPLRYIENSPIFWADKVQTPLLMIHNDEDGAVPWYQGIEYIMALRRLEKEAYMFNYNGEEHGLRKRVNQKHWFQCMKEFFDHHLKGAPEPDWMKYGIKAWEKEKK
ncbi:MAG: S9 family peptidase [Candidatus Aminicenantes bacterium]|nr:S9 family peptidase [Candidatus Aminicenantes bacterium]